LHALGLLAYLLIGTCDTVAEFALALHEIARADTGGAELAS